jgi:hypothetical protein
MLGCFLDREIKVIGFMFFRTALPRTLLVRHRGSLLVDSIGSMLQSLAGYSAPFTRRQYPIYAGLSLLLPLVAL